MTIRDAEELSLAIPGLRLAARAWGDPGGRRVLALHGWLDNAASFDRLAPLLPESLRLVCLDLPGHGRSDHRARDAFQHLFDYVPQIFYAVDALGWHSCALIGHSMGGAIATLAAGTVPDRVSHLVAIEGLGPITDAPDAAPERMERYIEEHAAWVRGRPPRAYATRDEAIAARMAQRQAPLTREAAEALTARGLRQDEDGFYWRYDPRARLSSMLRLSEAQVLAFLRRIRCPVLAIGAGSGWPGERGAGRERLAQLHDVRVLRRPGVHHLHLNTPAAIAEDIGDFLLDRSALPRGLRGADD